MPSFQPNSYQREFMEIGEWALNTNVARGSGRSTVMAYVAIQMAIRGATVHLLDPSLVFSHGSNYSVHRHFSRLVVDIALRYFPDFEFELKNVTNTFKCLGPRVRFTPIVEPVPEPVRDFDDDGSEENT